MRTKRHNKKRRIVFLGVSLLFLGLILAYFLSGWGLRQSTLGREYYLIGYWTEAGGRSFDDPFAVAVDRKSGNVLVTDARHGRVAVFEREGKFLREFGDSRQLDRPTGIAVGADGAVYVADYNRDKVLKFSETGEFLLEWGGAGADSDRFQAPNGLSVDATGHVYVADFQNKVVKVFDGSGRFLKTIGSPGQVGSGALDYPTDVDVAGGRIFVADAYNYRVQVFDLEGQHVVSWGRHVGRTVPRPGADTAGFNVPTGVAHDTSHGLLHVADSANRRVVMLDAEGSFISAWALKEPKENYSPTMVAVSPDGSRVYATDTANDRVLVLGVR